MALKIVESFLTLNPCYVANVQKADSRYTTFQSRGPLGGMLHSVGTSQPDASVFVQNWNKSTYTRACVHAFIDANSGTVYQTLPWDFRGWHCAGTANNTHVGVEMCESKHIRYFKPGEPGYAPAKFEILDRAKAVEDCVRTYHSAVELFAKLALQWHWNPDTDIISHKEGGKKGIASGHVDPEHYWIGLGMPYTMDGFRADVKRKMEELTMPTAAELEEIITRLLDEKFSEKWNAEYKKTMESLKDNDAGKWSKEAREWAVESGLIAGVGKLPDGETNYAWEQPLTREQYVTIEYRQALNGSCGI